MKLSKKDFGLLAVCAIRYCQGRMTYMPDLIRRIVRAHLSDLTDKDLLVMVEDCEFQERMHMYGDDTIDKPGWIEWKASLMAEQKMRKSKGEEGR